MQPPFPSLVPTWHNDVYPAIDPNEHPGTHEGKTIIITGAGGVIGRATAEAFATAGAKHLILIGRTDSTLEKTKSLLSRDIQVSKYVADITDDVAVGKIAERIGLWDVLILNAGYNPAPAPAAKANLKEYWQAYETNVKSLIVLANAFFPTANPAGAAAISVTSGSLMIPAKVTLGMSAYQNSKLAAVKTIEYLALENPNIFCAAVGPGIVDTPIFRASGVDLDALPMNTARLPASFFVWITLPEAKFLNGKFLWANWDVEEMKAKAEEISSGLLLTATIDGWPFPHMG